MGTDAGVDQLRDGFRIAERPGAHVVQPLRYDFGQHRHHILIAARATIIAVIDQHDGPLARRDRPCGRNRLCNGFDLEDERLTLVPELLHEIEQEPLRRIPVSVGNDDAG